MPAQDKPVSIPPYVAFPTFTGFIETLSKTALPTQIDRSIMPKMSGVTQSHLLSALRFMKLVNEEGHVAADLRHLVKAYGTDEWKDAFGSVVSDAYLNITQSVDLDAGTQKQLFDAFKARGHVDGQMLDKAVRFYIRASESAGWTFSPHFKVRKPRVARQPGNRPRAGVGKAGSAENNGGTPRPETPPEGTIDFPIHLRGKPAGVVRVPVDLTEGDCAVIESMLPMLRAYAKGGAKR